MMRQLLIGLVLICAFACKQPTRKKNKPDASSQSNPTTLTSASTSQNTAEPGEPTEKKDDLKLTMSATAPAIEIPPIVPRKSDAECEVPELTLSDTDKVALLKTYIEIQKDYLIREKGVKNVKETPDPKNPLVYEVSFQDLFGNPAKMNYKFGKAVAKNDLVTLCLDEGSNIFQWAGNYKRDAAKKFVQE